MNIKTVPFQQSQNQGCGYYVLANLFNDTSFIEGVKMNHPIRVEHMNLKLRELQPEMFVDMVYLTNASLTGATSFLNERNGFELMKMLKPQAGKVIPVSMSIVTQKGTAHMMLVLMDSDLHVWLVDSTEEYVISGDLRWLLRSHHIVGIAVLGVHIEGNQGIATFDIEQLNHLI